VPGARPLSGEMKVGYINVTGFDDLGRLVNVQTASPGDPRAQTNAMADWVNKRGGIGGKKLTPVVIDYRAQEASAQKDVNTCTQFVQDHKVFAAVLHGQIHQEARDCYVQRKTLALEGANYGFSADFYKRGAPYIWAPSIADYDETSRALVATLKSRNWFAGDPQVGVVRWDDQPYKDVLERSLKPALQGAGVRNVVEQSVSNADIAGIQTGLNAAIRAFNAAGVKRVFFLGSAPLQPFFFDSAKNQGASFIYAMTSFDSPRYNMERYKPQMVGALGIGFSPANDLLDPQHPFPQPGRETECVNIYKAYGITFPARVNDKSTTRQAMSYCETTLLLKAAADKVQGDLTAASWSAAAESLGSSFPMAMTHTTRFGPGDHTGAATYRVLQYDTACGCNKYVSGDQAF
jgi:ABC-type branched-subunit amino acid transport system substrate-binding protein